MTMILFWMQLSTLVSGCWEAQVFDRGITSLTVQFGSANTNPDQSAMSIMYYGKAANMSLSMDLYFPPRSLGPLEDGSLDNTDYGSLFDLQDIQASAAEPLWVPGNVDNRVLRPAMVLAHGGGLTGGLRTNNHIPRWCIKLVQYGFVCSSIDYRLLGATGIAYSVQDTRAALRHMHTKAAEWHIDASKIALGGDSAGGAVSIGFAYMAGPGLADSGYSNSETASDSIACCIAMSITTQPVAGIDIAPSTFTRGHSTPLSLIQGTMDTHVHYTDAEQFVSDMGTGRGKLDINYDFLVIVGGLHEPVDQLISDRVPVARVGSGKRATGNVCSSADRRLCNVNGKTKAGLCEGTLANPDWFFPQEEISEYLYHEHRYGWPYTEPYDHSFPLPTISGTPVSYWTKWMSWIVTTGMNIQTCPPPWRSITSIETPVRSEGGAIVESSHPHRRLLESTPQDMFV